MEAAGSASRGRDGVLLLGMGGPWTLPDVKPFLLSIFGDRQVIRFPGGPALQGSWARLLTLLRSRAVRSRYAAIGGGSPLLHWTSRQAAALSRALGGTPVEVAMRYASPRAPESVSRLAAAGCGRIVLLPLYPQECGATTGTSLDDARGAVAGHGRGLEAVVVRSFHDDPAYVRSVAARVRSGLSDLSRDEADRPFVLFSAHGVPERVEHSGDPYVTEVRRTAELVLTELGPEVGEHGLSFQSRVGPVRWVGPATASEIRRLGREGRKAVLVVPISFVSDHIETLHEIDIELRGIAARAGIQRFGRAPSLNDGVDFVEALAGIASRALAGGETTDA
ncbi:MAG TPA: ferrochelatase [Polyangia bacterium]|nr:ferrochelatase [Polyangia bacterium]